MDAGEWLSWRALEPSTRPCDDCPAAWAAARNAEGRCNRPAPEVVAVAALIARRTPAPRRTTGARVRRDYITYCASCLRSMVSVATSWESTAVGLCSGCGPRVGPGRIIA